MHLSHHQMPSSGLLGLHANCPPPVTSPLPALRLLHHHSAHTTAVSTDPTGITTLTPLHTHTTATQHSPHAPGVTHTNCVRGYQTHHCRYDGCRTTCDPASLKMHQFLAYVTLLTQGQVSCGSFALRLGSRRRGDYCITAAVTTVRQARSHLQFLVSDGDILAVGITK